MGRLPLTYEEALALGDIEGIANVAPVISGNATAKNKTDNVSVTVEGITPLMRRLKIFMYRRAASYLILITNTGKR